MYSFTDRRHPISLSTIQIYGCLIYTYIHILNWFIKDT